MQHSTLYTLVFLAIVCLVFSVLVSSTAVALRARQEANAKLDKQANVLAVAGLIEPGAGVTAEEAEQLFSEHITVRFVNLETDDYAENEDELRAQEYDMGEALKDPNLSEDAPPNPAQVLRLPKYAIAYQVDQDADDKIDLYILPIKGKGLWGTMYGLLALNKDGDTIEGITFYQHQETPGLGGEVDNPRWKKLWEGRDAYNDAGAPHIQVVKGTADEANEVDGLSGATLTSRGVTNLVQFWLGEHGYGDYVAKLREQQGSAN